MPSFESDVRNSVARASSFARVPNYFLKFLRNEEFYKLVDVLLILTSGIASGAVYHIVTIGNAGGLINYASISIVVAAFFVLVGSQKGLYVDELNLKVASRLKTVALIWFATFLFLSAVAFGLKIGAEFSRGFISTFLLCGVTSLCAYRVVCAAALRRADERGAVSHRPIFLVGPSHAASDRQFLQQLYRAGYSVAAVFSWDLKSVDGVPSETLRDTVSRAVTSTWGSGVEEIVFVGDAANWIDARELLRGQPLPVKLIPRGGVEELVGRPARRITDLTVVDVQRGPLSPSERAAKRALDLIVATVGLIVLLPLLGLVACAIRLDSPGPILFRQARHGFNGKKFRIYKFRSMFVQEDGSIVRQASRHDVRVTSIGKWLRRTSLDEVPQLLNVARGEMSIVGPRPHAIAHDTYYDKLVANYAWRHHVKPGLTGWAQVKGHRGETPKIEDMARRVEHDIWYVDNCSVWLDIKIIMRTMLELLRTRDVY